MLAKVSYQTTAYKDQESILTYNNFVLTLNANTINANTSHTHEHEHVSDEDDDDEGDKNFEKGDRVAARWQGSEEYHPGVVVKNNEDGTCHIEV